MLHSLFNSQIMTAYVFPTALVQKADGTKCPISEIPAGTYLRCIIRIHGLMMVEYRGNPSIRIQHSVPGMYGEEGTSTR